MGKKASASYRDSQTDTMRAKRADAKDVAVPPCEDRERRALLESDDAEWLLWYFAADSGGTNPFTYAWTSQQSEMISAIGHAIQHGGDQAIAASRGEGKTTIAERLLLKYTLQGAIPFSVLFSATGSSAENSLDSIKGDLTDNDRLLSDYPEACAPIRALENTPNRAHYMTVSGARHDTGEAYERHPARFKWCGNQIFLPDVPGAPCSAAVIATRGLDSAVRGLKVRGKRPLVALIDDPDTEDTARSQEQAAKLEERIDKGIGGLGSQRKPIARVMLTTLQSRISASYKFTDPAQKPSWSGKRFRYLVAPPTRVDLWEEYVAQRVADMQAGDKHARTAHALFMARRVEMEAGAVVANPNRYDATILADGSQVEVSALQRYYNEVARIGAEAVATEYDNNPPEESGVVESGITHKRILRQLSGYDRKMIPPDCTVITGGMDVRKTALHWVLRAWKPDATGYTIDYGYHEVRGTVYGSDEGVDQAIHRAILEFLEQLRNDQGYVDTDGQTRRVDLMLVDAGWRTDAVYAACAEAGVGVMPIMGFGRSAGCTRVNFSDIQRKTSDKRPGDGWFLSKRGRIWLVAADTDRWKAWEHDRWMTSPENPGCMFLFGQGSESQGGRMTDDEKRHFGYAKHICNEVEVEEPYKGTMRRRWKAKSENTHWFDASYYADVAASIKGIKLRRAETSKATKVIPRGTALPAGAEPEGRPAPVAAPQAAAAGPRRLSLADMRRRA